MLTAWYLLYNMRNEFDSLKVVLECHNKWNDICRFTVSQNSLGYLFDIDYDLKEFLWKCHPGYHKLLSITWCLIWHLNWAYLKARFLISESQHIWIEYDLVMFYAIQWWFLTSNALWQSMVYLSHQGKNWLACDIRIEFIICQLVMIVQFCDNICLFLILPSSFHYSAWWKLFDSFNDLNTVSFIMSEWWFIT